MFFTLLLMFLILYWIGWQVILLLMLVNVAFIVGTTVFAYKYIKKLTKPKE